MRIAIVTDAWHPQVNGVVRTLEAVRDQLLLNGHDVSIISPDRFRSLPCPTYPDIRLSCSPHRVIWQHLEAADPDAVHISTEGPLGVAARRWCLRNGFPFTTAYHTQFPEYLSRRTGFPAKLFWRYIQWFHRPARRILVATETLSRQLCAQGLAQTSLWTRGVDLASFHPNVPPHPTLAALPRPIQLYVGRVAVEKNLEAFLSSEVAGSKVVIGDGPELERLKKLYPQARFPGALTGSELASAYTAADVFVFPSRTDTFGLVIIEALASGVPVAAFPVPGPADILTDDLGAMDECLSNAIERALAKDKSPCAAHAAGYNWSASARQFEGALVSMMG
ncbi:MAG: glycosyltransferase family 1 protein [Sphingosinicella sp.]|nr:glycosyltransferase family 1 protein [Sphingosinicella sp.]